MQSGRRYYQKKSKTRCLALETGGQGACISPKHRSNQSQHPWQPTQRLRRTRITSRKYLVFASYAAPAGIFCEAKARPPIQTEVVWIAICLFFLLSDDRLEQGGRELWLRVLVLPTHTCVVWYPGGLPCDAMIRLVCCCAAARKEQEEPR